MSETSQILYETRTIEELNELKKVILISISYTDKDDTKKYRVLSEALKNITNAIELKNKLTLEQR
jgi:hypothetical protein